MSEGSTNPLVSVVLYAGSADQLEALLTSAKTVFSQTYSPVELVVVVDGPVEVFWEIDQAFDGRDGVKLALNSAPVGPQASRERGARLAEGDLITFVDDHPITDERWVEDGVEADGPPGPRPRDGRSGQPFFQQSAGE